MKKVSVIIPVYNAEKYIDKCIPSLLGQTYTNLELLVINDGSQDHSRELLEKYASQDMRIKLHTQPNQGVSAARNQGLGMATGEYLLFVDGDDYLGKNYIENLVSCLEREKADLVIGGLTMVDEQDQIVQKIIPDGYVSGEKEEWTFKLSCVAAHLYRRKLWEDYGVTFGLGVRGEDIPIALFFSAVCSHIVTAPEAGYYYVQHTDSAVHSFQGLKQYALPYEALEQAIRQVRKAGLKNGWEFHELFVLRVLATFISLAKGAGKEKIQELADYNNRILKEYFPQYYKNKKARLFSKVQVPFMQKLAVWVMIRATRVHLLLPFLKLVCR